MSEQTEKAIRTLRPQPVSKVSMIRELGTTGLERSGTGTIDEEFLTELRGERGVKVYREMRDNDPTIGAVMFAVEMILRQVTWFVEGAGESSDDEDAKYFLETCVDDMSHTFADLISEILSMMTFGWSFHEIVYKRRMGDVRDPTRRSKYDDGRVGWRKLPIRAQDTLDSWVFDEGGGLRAMVQRDINFNRVEIPIEKALLFRTTSHKNNPEGRSMMRNAYRPWYFKRRIEEIEAIGIERDLAGLPIFYLDQESYDKYKNDYKRIIRNVRRDQQEGLILPSVFDENNNRMVSFDLLTSGGRRQFDTNQIITRYDTRIAMTILADFVMLGHERVGSFALSSSKTDLFAVALGTIMDEVAAVMNRHAVPRLFALNGFDLEELPSLRHGDVETPDLEELANYVQKLAQAGMPLFPDRPLEQRLRDAAGLPEPPEEDDSLTGLGVGPRDSRRTPAREGPELDDTEDSDV